MDGNEYGCGASGMELPASALTKANGLGRATANGAFVSAGRARHGGWVGSAARSVDRLEAVTTDKKMNHLLMQLLCGDRKESITARIGSSYMEQMMMLMKVMVGLRLIMEIVTT